MKLGWIILKEKPTMHKQVIPYLNEGNNNHNLTKKPFPNMSWLNKSNLQIYHDLKKPIFKHIITYPDGENFSLLMRKNNKPFFTNHPISHGEDSNKNENNNIRQEQKLILKHVMTYSGGCKLFSNLVNCNEAKEFTDLTQLVLMRTKHKHIFTGITINPFSPTTQLFMVKIVTKTKTIT